MNEPIFMIEKPPPAVAGVLGGLRKFSFVKSQFVKRGGTLLACAALAHAAFAADPALPPPAQTKVDFVHDIQPILSKHCYSCHGPDKQEKELRWDIKSVALKGGTSGPAILP